MEEEVEVIIVSELGRLEIARAAAARKRGKKIRVCLRKINSQLAYGFDYGSDFCIVEPPVSNEYDVTLYARLGLYCYNFQKGTNFKFVRWEKYNTEFTSNFDHYITLAARDPSCNSFFSFQTVFSAAGCSTQGTYRVKTWRVLACRPTCNKPVDDYWDRDEEIDPFYTGEMPKWLSDEALTSDNKKYYVVQESELHENEWLHLFIEIAFYSKAKTNPELVEINKVVVETKEDYISEAREKLHAENAIFYISYKYTGVSSSGLAGDHKAIIRKTMDGITEHMSLEVASEHG
ncbi:UPF0725 protein At5g63820 isoform X1 [Arabidopsis lyrata subsp. lyrata]|uniref:UPF0725 protein At5g63820 isoform X1 n=1 Tax=Arabidopsis lyrata subsp. lyrata TaxID=81972 RepID=UPI000A29A5AC|nr:UPF0725 protein At5g63820 isoform X1 [Arabidopsis lyrata subsp. lyrata]|eukprot:XP_020869868.1 UPF0725 protein At5g63820 isoform X1 [Arabidopsis lyrata subsp. lyrata]